MSDNIPTSKQLSEIKGAENRGGATSTSATSMKMISHLDRPFCVEVMIPNEEKAICDMLELQDLPEPYQPVLHAGMMIAIRMDTDVPQWDVCKVVRRLPSIVEHPHWKEEAGYHVIRAYDEDGELGQYYLAEMVESHSWEGIHHISSRSKMQSFQQRLSDDSHPYNQLPTLQMYLLEDDEVRRLDEQVPDTGDDILDPVDQAIMEFVKGAKVIEEGRGLEMHRDLFVGVRRVRGVQHSPQARGGKEEQSSGRESDDEDIEDGTPHKSKVVRKNIGTVSSRALTSSRPTRHRKIPSRFQDFELDMEDWEDEGGREERVAPPSEASLPVRRVMRPGYPSSEQSCSPSSCFSIFKGSRAYPGKILAQNWLKASQEECSRNFFFNSYHVISRGLRDFWDQGNLVPLSNLVKMGTTTYHSARNLKSYCEDPSKPAIMIFDQIKKLKGHRDLLGKALEEVRVMVEVRTPRFLCHPDLQLFRSSLEELVDAKSGEFEGFEKIITSVIEDGIETLLTREGGMQFAEWLVRDSTVQEVERAVGGLSLIHI